MYADPDSTNPESVDLGKPVFEHPQLVITRFDPQTMGPLPPEVDWHFQSFADRAGGLTQADDFRTAVFAGLWQCWIASCGRQVRAVALTHLAKERPPVVEITHCAGQGRGDWQDILMDRIETWASEIGARGLRATVRPGWRPFLRGRDYRLSHVVLEKPTTPPDLGSTLVSDCG